MRWCWSAISVAAPATSRLSASSNAASALPRPRSATLGSPSPAIISIIGSSTRSCLSPRLGKGTLFKSIDKILPIPQHYHGSFARWHQLAMLKTPEHIREFERLQRTSLSPNKITKFIETGLTFARLGLHTACSHSRNRSVDRCQRDIAAMEN